MPGSPPAGTSVTAGTDLETGPNTLIGRPFDTWVEVASGSCDFRDEPTKNPVSVDRATSCFSSRN